MLQLKQYSAVIKYLIVSALHSRAEVIPLGFHSMASILSSISLPLSQLRTSVWITMSSIF